MKREFYTVSRIRRKRSLLQRTPKMLERRNLRLFGKRSSPERLELKARRPGRLRCPLPRQKNGHGSRGRRGPGKSKSFFPFLRPQRRTERKSPRQQHHSTPTSSSSGEWSHPPVFDDEPTTPGEEPPQRESYRRRNGRRNIRRHHEAGERDPA